MLDLAVSLTGKRCTRGEAEGAVADAQSVLETCGRHLPRPD